MQLEVYSSFVLHDIRGKLLAAYNSYASVACNAQRGIPSNTAASIHVIVLPFLIFVVFDFELSVIDNFLFFFNILCCNVRIVTIHVCV